MRKKVLLLMILVVLFLAVSASAVVEPEELPGIFESGAAVATDILPELQPLINVVQPFFLRLSVLVGGIFGLYIILIALRVYYDRKKIKLLKDIRYDLDNLNMSHGLSYSRGRKGIIRKTFSAIRLRSQERKVRKKLNRKSKKINRVAKQPVSRQSLRKRKK